MSTRGSGVAALRPVRMMDPGSGAMAPVGGFEGLPFGKVTIDKENANGREVGNRGSMISIELESSSSSSSTLSQHSGHDRSYLDPPTTNYSDRLPSSRRKPHMPIAKQQSLPYTYTNNYNPITYTPLVSRQLSLDKAQTSLGVTPPFENAVPSESNKKEDLIRYLQSLPDALFDRGSVSEQLISQALNTGQIGRVDPKTSAESQKESESRRSLFNSETRNISQELTRSCNKFDDAEQTNRNINNFLSHTKDTKSSSSFQPQTDSELISKNSSQLALTQDKEEPPGNKTQISTWTGPVTASTESQGRARKESQPREKRAKSAGKIPVPARLARSKTPIPTTTLKATETTTDRSANQTTPSTKNTEGNPSKNNPTGKNIGLQSNQTNIPSKTGASHKAGTNPKPDGSAKSLDIKTTRAANYPRQTFRR